PASRIVDLGHVARQAVSVEEGSHRNGFLGFLVDHQRHADAAVGMTAAGELAPIGVGTVYQVRPDGEGAHKADGEPIAGGLAQPGLVLDVVGHVAEGVALRYTALVADILVTAGEGD